MCRNKVKICKTEEYEQHVHVVVKFPEAVKFCARQPFEKDLSTINRGASCENMKRALADQFERTVSAITAAKSSPSQCSGA